MKTVDEWFKETTGFELKGHWAEVAHRETWAAASQQAMEGQKPSTNTSVLSASQIAAFKEAFGALSEAREKLLESDNKFAAVWRQLQHT